MALAPITYTTDPLTRKITRSTGGTASAMTPTAFPAPIANTVPATTTQTQLPYTYPNTITPLNAPSVAPVQQTPTQAGNEQVLLAAQEAATKGFQSPVMEEVNKQTLSVLQNPQTAEAALAKQNTMLLEQQDRERAQATENAMRQMAGAGMDSGSGVANKALLDIAMQGVQAKTDLQRQLEAETATRQQENIFKGLAEGRSTAEQARQGFATNINALATVRGAAEGEEQRAATAELQKGSQEWQTGERVASQGWQTGERISSQDYQSAEAVLNRKLEESMQANDIENTRYLEDQKSKLALAMQTNEMDHETKLTYLNNELATARAEGDVGREKQILEFQHAQEIDTLLKTQTFDQVMQNTQNELQLLLQNNEFASAAALQKTMLTAQATENDKNRTIDQARLKLEEKGLNYAWIEAAVEAGTIAPDAAVSFLQNEMGKQGISITPPDPEATQKAIMDEYDNMRLQYALTNPGYLKTPGDPTGGLTEEGEQAFNTYYNKAIYGMAGMGEGGVISIASSMNTDNINLGGGYPSYWDAESNAWMPISTGSTITFEQVMKNNEVTMPAGTYKLINVDGNLWYENQDTGRKYDAQYLKTQEREAQAAKEYALSRSPFAS